VHCKYIQIYIQQDATLHSLYLETALHISGGTSTHYQERHPQHTQTGFNSSTIAADSSNGVTNTRCCRYSCMRFWWWWKYHPKHVEQFPDINKLCNFASCWIHKYIEILLGVQYILHISRIRVNNPTLMDILVLETLILHWVFLWHA
jgi:hypothetical protein